MKKLTFDFIVSNEMVDTFARITGDQNSMHMNDEVARKSRYRRRVVHGMLPLSFIMLLQTEFPERSITFRTVESKFIKPIFPGDHLCLDVQYTEEPSDSVCYKALWHRVGEEEILTRSQGDCKLTRSNSIGKTDEPASNSFLLEPLDEDILEISKLDGKQEKFQFKITENLLSEYVNSIFGKTKISLGKEIRFCPNLASMMMLSTMVGMKLPGRYATFTGFSIDVNKNIKTNKVLIIEAIVKKVSVLSESFKTEVKIKDKDNDMILGNIEAIVNPPPRVMLTCQVIFNEHVDLGIKDKVVLVTGSSRGIGETTVKLFAMLGAKVVVNYFKGKEDAEEIVKEIRNNGGRAISVSADISKEQDVLNLIDKTIEAYKRIDILVNNAVKDFAPKSVSSLTWSDYQEELEVDLKGLHLCCQAVLPVFMENKGGKIINLSTVAVDNPVSGQSRYITAKSAVVGYTKSLAKEYAKDNIQINLVVPNMTETDLVSGIPRSYQSKMAKSRAYNRHVLPIEVAQSIVFLSSQWSNAMTGQKVVLNLGEPPFA